MEVNGKRVLVVGLGKSGVASALFLKAHGARVTVSDTKSGDELRNEIPVLLDHGITVETGGHGDRTFRGQDLIVVSPGVPVDAPPLVQARAAGEAVIGEIELAARFLPGPIVAITGSNGKTTTTSLTGEIMTAAGFPALASAHTGRQRSLQRRAQLRTPVVEAYGRLGSIAGVARQLGVSEGLVKSVLAEAGWNSSAPHRWPWVPPRGGFESEGRNPVPRAF